jgi:hypothetical protein
MKSAVIPQIRVEPELRAELESVLKQGETLTDFVEATVRNAIAFRRVQTAFHARAQAASEEYHRTGVSVPVEAVLEKLQSKLDAKRKKLGFYAISAVTGDGIDELKFAMADRTGSPLCVTANSAMLGPTTRE